ncbi:rhomboid family intramembrane serine protease [Rhodovulum sulfidophilum]|uniref:rhomboid family intramembrane serine protease n=1 Tax=Rhodovulum sulfidophilum TaxID=35806 RepID=UPI0019272427|nr:rhomboid family intramembrane serine protease [Rhodovulum sulfidophilum]MBL3586432.1 rhomboid family intramembrane serine protease [Rhodovulum sulfidophilum]
MAVLRRGRAVLIGLIALCTLLELTLSLSDAGLLAPRLRTLAYDYGGFWPGLLGNWKPNYPAQPYAMFVTYSVLHGGPAHLAVNMITLWSLGSAVIDRVGAWRFGLLYGASILGGAAGFALLAPDLRPMVGASGALFGLAGGLIAWASLDRVTYRETLWPVIRAVLLLLGLNVVLWWAMHGMLAWQTHLGGFLVGALCALALDRHALGPEDA